MQPRCNLAVRFTTCVQAAVPAAILGAVPGASRSGHLAAASGSASSALHLALCLPCSNGSPLTLTALESLASWRRISVAEAASQILALDESARLELRQAYAMVHSN